MLYYSLRFLRIDVVRAFHYGVGFVLMNKITFNFVTEKKLCGLTEEEVQIFWLGLYNFVVNSNLFADAPGSILSLD